ncbi:MAG: NADH-quinone oxidoreductase subunit M [Verrucomicrobiota bacterium]|nr:NADH-quinone oxidoreductase subunit M [Verrucomicrobiota bacterium]
MDPLTIIITAPLAAAGLVAVIPGNYRFLIRVVALLATLVSAAVAIWVFAAFEPGASGLQFETKSVWVKSLGIGYRVGLDGVNVGLVLMGALVAFAAACVSRDITEREKEYYLLLLLMAGGILGAFLSCDMFAFYFFHELALVPTFLMIGIWGRGEDRVYATYQITLYLSFGALLVLVGLIALYVQCGAQTFDMVELQQQVAQTPVPASAQRWMFPLLMFGFGILASLWPFHSWAPAGYAAAPTGVAMLHAAVIKKFGLLGLVRVALPLLPDGAREWVPVMGALAVGNLLYGGWVAMRQTDLNRLLGYSSVAHMGFAFLGLASLTILGVTGAVVVMIAHGFLSGLSFALSGYLRRVAGTTQMERMGGLLDKVPFIGALLVMAMLAGCGVPGFANFVGELLVLFGAWEVNKTWVVLAAWAGLVVGAVYTLRAVRTILHGPLRTKLAAAADPAGAWHRSAYAALVVVLLLFGVAPGLLTARIKPNAKAVLGAAAKRIEMKAAGENGRNPAGAVAAGSVGVRQ